MVPIPNNALEVTLRIARRRASNFTNRFISSKLRSAAERAGRLDDAPYVEGVIGYLGDICAAVYLGLDPIAELQRMLVETDLLTHRDKSDLVYRGHRVDVKTELIPDGRRPSVIDRSIGDNEPYGKRLINKDQLDDNEEGSDIYLFGTLDSEDPFQATNWIPVGFITSRCRKDVAPIATRKPGAATIPYPAYAIPTSALSAPSSLSLLARGPRPTVSALARFDVSQIRKLESLIQELGFNEIGRP